MMKINNEKGSAFFMVLIAIVLFAALTYAISNMDNSANNLSAEKSRLHASEIIDQGNKFADAVVRIRLKSRPTMISFENTSVAGYTNAACLNNNRLFFNSDGGGMEWQTPATSINQGENWGFTGDISVERVGTTDADLLTILPNIPLTLCQTINSQLSQASATATPSVIASITADKFTGTYNASPDNITAADLDGKTSGCFMATLLDGTAIDGAPINNVYVYYHVLLAR